MIRNIGSIQSIFSVRKCSVEVEVVAAAVKVRTLPCVPPFRFRAHPALIVKFIDI